ncbi:hypothetical protein D3C85_1937700 [compost metagenome]
MDLIHEFKTTRAIDENIKVKLKGFKKEYALENSSEVQNHVTIEHHYDFIKREMVEKVVVKEDF